MLDFGFGPETIVDDPISTDLQHANLYVYSYIKPIENVTLTVGASGDFVDGDSPEVENQDSFNPKFGINWTPFDGTTVRGAAFKTLKRTLITDQTLEPTQVAGFNQFFDDLDATEAWRYGAAVDQKFLSNVYGGAEFSYRDMDVPAIDLEGGTFDEKWEEYLGRAYLYWAPHAWVSLRADYIYEQFKTEGLTDYPEKLDTHRVPLGCNFFHPSGLNASVTATYYNQDGDFITVDGERKPGEDDFWLVDASIGYRLPKRYGIITAGVRNLFDEEFSYYDRDPDNLSIQPDRTFYVAATLAFP